MSERLRPPFSYIGSKDRLREWVVGHLPRSGVTRYVETCVGSGAVLCAIDPPYPQEVINDLDGGVSAFWRALRDHEEELTRLCLATPYSRPEWCAARDIVRSTGYPADTLEAARLFILLSQMTFGRVNRPNSGWRIHGTDKRTGWVAREWANLPERWPAVAHRLHGVVIDEADVSALAVRHDSPSTLYYIDPPYHPSTAGMSQCYRLWMTHEQHEQMAAVLNGVQGMVVLSGYPCAAYDAWFAGWRRVDRAHSTHLGTMRKADGAIGRTECLWLNPAACAALEADHLRSGLFGAPAAPGGGE